MKTVSIDTKMVNEHFAEVDRCEPLPIRQALSSLEDETQTGERNNTNDNNDDGVEGIVDDDVVSEGNRDDGSCCITDDHCDDYHVISNSTQQRQTLPYIEMVNRMIDDTILKTTAEETQDMKDDKEAQHRRAGATAAPAARKVDQYKNEANGTGDESASTNLVPTPSVHAMEGKSDKSIPPSEWDDDKVWNEKDASLRHDKDGPPGQNGIFEGGDDDPFTLIPGAIHVRFATSRHRNDSFSSSSHSIVVGDGSDGGNESDERNALPGKADVLDGFCFSPDENGEGGEEWMRQRIKELQREEQLQQLRIVPSESIGVVILPDEIPPHQTRETNWTAIRVLRSATKLIKSYWRRIIVVILILVCCAIIAIRFTKQRNGEQKPMALFSPSQSPSASQVEESITPEMTFVMNIILSNNVTAMDDINDQESPQFQALHWLVYSDPYFQSVVPLIMYDKEDDADSLFATHKSNSTDDVDNLTASKTSQSSPSSVSLIVDKLVERYALAVFFYSTNGPGWNRHFGWLREGGDVCSFWKGIDCTYYVEDDADNHMETAYYFVTSINFGVGDEIAHFLPHNPPNSLFGTLPAEIGLLTHLRHIYIRERLFGQIPTGIGLLSDLETLFLPFNSFSRKIPTEIGLLRKLQHLHLGSNRLEGTLPTEIGALTGLTYLSVGSNAIAGAIPADVGRLTNLKTLGLSANNFSGSIPNEIGLLMNGSLFGSAVVWNPSIETIALIGNKKMVGDLNPIFCDASTNFTNTDKKVYPKLSTLTSDCDPRFNVICGCCTQCE